MNTLKNNGFEVVDFIHIAEEEMYSVHPLAGSFAIIKCEGKYLICYNTWRKQWELPAGHREEHETPKQCAIRELYEETGQIVEDMDFKGVLKSKNTESMAVKYNPVYFATLDTLQPFLKNAETSTIKLWDFSEEIGSIGILDYKLMEYFTDENSY